MGDGDRSYNRSQTNLLRDQIPAATLKIIVGAAHLAHLEQPQKFANLVGDFLSDYIG